MNQGFAVYLVCLRKITRLVKAEQRNACVLPINLLAGMHAMDIAVKMPCLHGSNIIC